MNALLPGRDELAQLSRLRQLQVRRAQEALAASERTLETAANAVREREAQIAKLDDQLNKLAHTTVTSLASSLPRWGRIALAERDRLLKVHEFEFFMLSDESIALDQARENRAECGTALARAQARDDVVADLARQVRASLEQDQERLTDAENDDTISAAIAARTRLR